jgi:hypothetical protein
MTTGLKARHVLLDEKLIRENVLPRAVVFACVHNAGRSQMAAAFFNAMADTEKARAISAGAQPGERRPTWRRASTCARSCRMSDATTGRCRTRRAKLIDEVRRIRDEVHGRVGALIDAESWKKIRADAGAASARTCR